MKSHHASLNGDPVTSGDKNAANVARKLHGMVQELSMSAVHAEAENSVHALIILSQAACGLIHLLAKISMGEEGKGNPINSTATLFAALLAYHTAPCEVEPGKIVAEFSPLVIFDALKDAEKLSGGQRPDSLLDPIMCQVARDCAANPAMAAQINRERSVLHREGATLN